MIENKDLLQPYYETKSVGQLPLAECYGFFVTDKGWRVLADVWTTECGTKVKKRRKRDIVRMELDTPFLNQRSLRNIVVAKSGDGVVDFLLEELHHNSARLSTAVFTLIFIILRWIL
ncbi:hypothetical protein COOONC_08763 [Cooperia oncophora]